MGRYIGYVITMAIVSLALFISSSCVALAQTGQAVLSWNASTDPSVIGYYVYVGTQSGDYQTPPMEAGANTSYTVTGLSASQTYYFNVIAYTNDTDGPFTQELVCNFITAGTGSNGQISPGGASAVAGGGSQTYSIVPDSGYLIGSITVDGQGVCPTSSYTFSNVSGCHTIAATFIPCTTTRKMFWTSSSGQASIWTTNMSENITSDMIYGPYSGWTPISYDRSLSDGTTRLFWTNATGQACIWEMDPSDNMITNLVYGPYEGWTPVSYDRNPDGTARLFWTNSNGQVSIWELNSSDNMTNDVMYGPYPGWTPVSYDANGSGAWLLWKNVDGQFCLWVMNSSDNLTTQYYYGPYSGWSPLSVSKDIQNSGLCHLTWINSSGAICLWGLTSSTGSTTCQSYGPYSGWQVVSYSQSTADGAPFLSWNQAGSGQAALWDMAGSDNIVSYAGPFAGWSLKSVE